MVDILEGKSDFTVVPYACCRGMATVNNLQATVHTLDTLSWSRFLAVPRRGEFYGIIPRTKADRTIAHPTDLGDRSKWPIHVLGRYISTPPTLPIGCCQCWL